MTAMTNSVHSDPSGLMFFRFGFEVAAEHRFVFHEIMSGTKNLLRLYNKRVEKIVTVARKTGGGVSSVPVAELAECNFKLLVYYFKL